MEFEYGTFAPRARATVTAPDLAQEQLSQRLLDQRIVFIGKEVDDDLANRVCAQLLLLSANDRHRDITIYINSPGGVVDAGMAIYDIMQFLPNDVATVALGLAASMGQSLLAAGTHGKRYALRHARIMMHQPHGGIGGTASDIRIQAEQSLYLKRILAERNASDRDRWFTAEQAAEYGLIDHVIDSADMIGV
jgi:ATP-dependent Clp protease protease subunit